MLLLVLILLHFGAQIAFPVVGDMPPYVPDCTQGKAHNFVYYTYQPTRCYNSQTVILYTYNGHNYWKGKIIGDPALCRGSWGQSAGLISPTGV